MVKRTIVSMPGDGIGKNVLEEAIRERKVHPRLAAMAVAVARVAESCKLRAWV